MLFAISSYIPFPCISWWAAASGLDTLMLDKAEHFEKMTYRNRYYLAGANGLLTLSIPLRHGRDQRAAMRDIQVDNVTKWQQQHWRSIVSTYKRSPYFDYYEPSLAPLFTQQYDHLTDVGLASILWLKQQLKLSFNITFAEEYLPVHQSAAYDLRKNLKRHSTTPYPNYYQLFADRTGFLPDLSILDLLFSEGPHTMDWIEKNKESLLERWL